MTYDWKKMDVVPTGSLAAWHQYVPGESTDGEVFDYSGNDRHLTAETNTPTLVDAVLNDQPAWYFDGTNNPLAWAGELQLRHVYMVASFDEAVLFTAQGLMSGLTEGEILTTEVEIGSFAFSGEPSIETPLSSALVPGTFGVIEVRYDEGVLLDGIQVGRRLDDMTSSFTGHYVETLAFEEMQNEFEQFMIAKYFAMRYHLWPQTA